MQDFLVSIFDWAIDLTTGFSLGDISMFYNAIEHIVPVINFLSYYLPMDTVLYIFELQIIIWSIRILIALWNTILQLT